VPQRPKRAFSGAFDGSPGQAESKRQSAPDEDDELADIEQVIPVEEHESVEEIEDAEENTTVFDERPPAHDE
jgi:hypothetical protein